MTTETTTRKMQTELDALDWIDGWINTWQDRFETTEPGTPMNLLAIRRLDRLEADRREVKATIKALRAAK